HRFFARALMLARPLMIVSGLISGYAAQNNLRLPWLIAGGGFAFTGLIAAVSMRGPRPPAALAGGGMHRSLGRPVREGRMAVRQAPVLMVLCALTMAVAFGAMPVHMLWQPRMQALTGEGTWLMGWIWALLNVTSFAGSALVPRLLGHVRREWVLCGAALW